MIMASTDISNTVGEQTDEKSSDRTTAAEREAAMQTAGASRQSTSGVDSSTWFSGWRLMLLRVAALVVTLFAWDVASGWLIRPVLVSSPPAGAETLWPWIEDGHHWAHPCATTPTVIPGFPTRDPT